MKTQTFTTSKGKIVMEANEIAILENGKIIASTSEKLNYPLLDRSLFVRGVDIGEIKTPLQLPQPQKGAYKHGFIDGHKANKAEYTEDDMIKAFKAGQDYENFDCQYAFGEWFTNYSQSLKPLSLPKEIKIEIEEYMEFEHQFASKGKLSHKPKTKDGKVIVVDIKF